jgi:hypothetical protein
VVLAGLVCTRGRYSGVEGGGSVHLLRPARLDGDSILCDPRHGLDGYQDGLLSHPQEASEANLQETHLALLRIDIEILHPAYPLSLCVVDVFAAEVVLWVCGHKVRVA